MRWCGRCFDQPIVYGSDDIKPVTPIAKMQGQQNRTTDATLRELMARYGIPCAPESQNFETPQERTSDAFSNGVQTSFGGAPQGQQTPRAESSILCSGVGLDAVCTTAATKVAQRGGGKIVRPAALSRGEIDRLLDSLGSSGEIQGGAGEVDKNGRQVRGTLKDTQKALLKEKMRAASLIQDAATCGKATQKKTAKSFDQKMPWCEAYGMQREVEKWKNMVAVKDEEIKALKAEVARLKSIQAARTATDERKAVFRDELAAAREENEVLRARIVKMEQVFQALMRQ